MLISYIKAIVSYAELWQQEVLAMLPPPPTPAPVQTAAPAPDAWSTSGSRSASRLAAALADVPAPAPAHAPVQSKKAAPASLKRVEALLLEGEKLPFQITKVRYTTENQIAVGTSDKHVMK